jgi:hypothetical protein
LSLVLYFGVMAALGGAVLFRRFSQGDAGPWRSDLLVLAIIALIFQTGIALMVGNVARRLRSKVAGYVLAAASFILLIALPLIVRQLL